MSRRTTQLFITTALTCVLTISIGSQARAGTATVNFGWEDTTSTVLGDFISGGSAVASYNSVTMGSELDYGPTDTPFMPPVEYNVTPVEGSRMLEININPVDEGDSDAVRPFLGYVENLDDGDTIQYSFKYYDPSDGRSPSVLVDGTYAQNGDITSFAGFFTPFQCFAPGTGWLDIVGDAACDDVTFPVDPNMVFDAGTMGDREAVVLRARPFRPSLSTMGNGGNGSYKFFLDDMRISVTSDNPLAQITLPDGSVTLVNPSTVSPADFNDDTFVNELDIDLLTMEIAFAADPDEATFDLNGDGVVNLNDITDPGDGWLAQAGAINLPSENPYFVGDANVDGTVNDQDFFAWDTFKFQTTGKWTEGDFNADGITDGRDFLQWNAFKFMSAAGVSAVPEPGMGLMAVLLGVITAASRRRRS